MNKSITPWVYIFITECRKYQKIGRTRKDPSDRMLQVQGGCTIRLNLYFCLKTENASLIEQALFLEFEKFRTVGEWFSLPEKEIKNLVSLIKERADQHG